LIRALGLALAAYFIGALPAARVLSGLSRRLVPGYERWVLLALEVLAGIVAVSLVGQRTDPLAQSLAATAAVAGRQWPLWPTDSPSSALGTAAGALSVITPVAVPTWAVLWGIVYVLSGYVGAGVLAATVLLPPVLGFFAGWGFALAAIAPCFLVLDRERAGLSRILRGEATRHLWR
jgi:glycerol-3-phosphate acyltransferase PlsY